MLNISDKSRVVAAAMLHRLSCLTIKCASISKKIKTLKNNPIGEYRVSIEEWYALKKALVCTSLHRSTVLFLFKCPLLSRF